MKYALAFLALLLPAGCWAAGDQTLVQQIMDAEGFRATAYNDSRNVPTIGYGTRLPLTQEERKRVGDISDGITKADAKWLLIHRLGETIDGLQGQWPPFRYMPRRVRNALAESGYVLGVDGLLEFDHALTACAASDYSRCGREFQRSKWYLEAPRRVERIAREIESMG